MADLYSLVYVSTATRLLAMDDIGRLLEKARQRNLDQDVTGVLLYSDGNFMQCLEGPAARLAGVYETIKSDSLHSASSISCASRSSRESSRNGRWRFGSQVHWAPLRRRTRMSSCRKDCHRPVSRCPCREACSQSSGAGGGRRWCPV